MSFSLKLLGGAALEGTAGPVAGPAVQRHRLALLALLAGARPQAQPRERLMAWLWPEHDGDRARALLNQAVHALRRTLGAEAVLSVGDELRLNPDIVRCDAVAFEGALAAGDPEGAVALYAGPFLDGFFLDDASEFERWVARERDRLETSYAKALDGLAESSEQAGNWSAAANWWKVRAAQDPHDSGVVLRLMDALKREGNPAGALRYAMAHQQRLREDFEIEPGAAVLEAMARLRRESGAAPAAGVRSEKQATIPPAPEFPATAAPIDRRRVVEPSSSRRRGIQLAGASLLLLVAVAAVVRLTPGRAAPAAVANPGGVDEIAQAVARELSRRERGDTAQQLPEHRTRSIPAYELYLRGNDPALLRSDSAARRGLGYFERAVALDSTYAAAWAGLARMRYRVSESEDIARRPGLRAEGEAAARKAVTLDPTLGEGHAILGLFRTMARDLPTAELHLQRAVALEPTRAVHREWLSNLYLLTGRTREALEEARQAVALDPLSPSAQAEAARALIAADRCDEAMTHLERVAAVDPPLLRVAPLMAQCYGRKGKWNEAIGVLKPQAERGDPLATAFLGYMYARAGLREQAAAVQSRLQGLVARGAEGAYYLAFVPAALANRDEAFRWLERGLEDGSFGFAASRSVPFTDLLFDDLKGDPRLEQLRARFLTPP